jgi:hypothetical protein
MTDRTDIARILLDALVQVPALRPAQPATVPARVPWDAALLAVDVDADQVTVRLVASELPLPPLLAQAGAVLQAALAAHGLDGVQLRLEVTDLDRSALEGTTLTGTVLNRAALDREALRPQAQRPSVTPDHEAGL